MSDERNAVVTDEPYVRVRHKEAIKKVIENIGFAELTADTQNPQHYIGLAVVYALLDIADRLESLDDQIANLQGGI